MREIKFRGKRADNGKWVYGDLCQVGHKRFIDDNYGKARVAPETVGQYTGLRDKNGQEVYEGDIVKDGNGQIGAVLCFGGTRKQPNGFGGFEQFSCYTKGEDGLWEHMKKINFVGMKVIGNIYDNPELLEVENERR